MNDIISLLVTICTDARLVKPLNLLIASPTAVAVAGLGGGTPHFSCDLAPWLLVSWCPGPGHISCWTAAVCLQSADT